MKKKTEKKKLVLAKETVRKIEAGDLQEVYGGDIGWTAHTCHNVGGCWPYG